MHDHPKGFHRLQYLAAALTHRSVRAGADSLNIAPSVVSRQISALEQELGLKLLVSKGRLGVEATEAAEILLECYRQQSACAELALSRLESMRGFNDASVRIVASGGFQPLLKSRICEILDFQSRFPITLEFMPTASMIKEILNGRFHFGLAYAPALDPEIEVIKRVKQPVMLMVAANHELACFDKPLGFELISKYSLALSSPSIGIRQLVHRVETYERVSLKPELTTNSLELLRSYVLSARGVVISPRMAFADEIASGKVIALPIQNSTFLSSEACLIKARSKVLPQTALECLSYMKRLPFFSRDVT